MIARIILGLILLTPLPAYSDDGRIKDLIAALRIEKEFSAFIPRWADEVAEKVQNNFAPKTSQEVHDIFRQEITRTLPEILNVSEQILTKAYSADEVEQLVAFYQTSPGQKTLQPWIGPAVRLELTPDETQIVSTFRETPLGQKDERITQCLKAQLAAASMGAMLTAHLRSEALLKNDISKSDLLLSATANFKDENPCP